MINPKRFAWFCCALSVLLLLCSACAESNVNSGANQEDISYTEIAVAAVETALKDRLKNPESLQVHSANLDGESFENDTAYFGTIVVDYSAQNSFGGYNRNTAKSYVEISKVDGVVTELDEASYYNRRIKAQFGDGLCSIVDGIPLQLICSDEHYSQLLTIIRKECGDFSTFTYKSGAKEVSCVANAGDLEGTATFLFYPENEKIWQINFFWSDGQSYYDGTNAYTLGTEYIATLNDVDELKEQIDNALNIPHGKIIETTETLFHDYSSLTQGGAIYSSSTLILDNCIFTGNKAVSGGGVYCSGDLTITDCQFSENQIENKTFGTDILSLGILTMTDDPRDGTGYYEESTGEKIGSCVFQGTRTGSYRQELGRKAAPGKYSPRMLYYKEIEYIL